MSNNFCVYAHTNTINGRMYIGITSQRPNIRWGEKGNGYKECPRFWGAIIEYGWDSFKHEILLTGLFKEEACDAEILLIKIFNTTNPKFGYNMSHGGDCPDPEISRSIWLRDGFKEATSQKMRDAWKDPEKRRRRSEATKARWQNPDFKNRVCMSINCVCGRSVQCVETQKVYPLIKDTAEELG